MQNIMTETPLFADKSFPLLFTPGPQQVDFEAWVEEHKAYLEQKILTHGCLVFRDFGIDSVEKFEKLCSQLCSTLYQGYGDLPPRSDSEKLYHATRYPANLPIMFHNEAAHTDQWPLKQFFYCIEAAEEGGELRLADGREVLKVLDPAVVAEFAEKGLMYVRNFIPYFDVSWQDFYKTKDKSEVEAFLNDNNIEFEWKGDKLTTRQYGPAVIAHPKTQENLWFNQIQLHHPSILVEKVYKGLKGMLGEESEFPRYVCFGDGSPIPTETVNTISEVLDQVAVNILAKPGDVIYDDNMLVAHCRTAFKGSRQVCVALGEAVSNPFTVGAK